MGSLLYPKAIINAIGLTQVSKSVNISDMVFKELISNSSWRLFAPFTPRLRGSERSGQRQLRREAGPQHQGQPGERGPVVPVPPDRDGNDHHQVGQVCQFFCIFLPRWHLLQTINTYVARL